MSIDFFTPIIFLIIGAVTFIFCFYLNQKRNKLLTTGIRVDGIVYGFTSRSGDDSSANYPVIRFLTKRNEWITGTYKVSYPRFILKQGQKVEVFYNPDNPSDFILNLKADRWLLLISAGVSIGCIGWGILSLFNEFSAK